MGVVVGLDYGAAAGGGIVVGRLLQPLIEGVLLVHLQAGELRAVLPGFPVLAVLTAGHRSQRHAVDGRTRLGGRGRGGLAALGDGEARCRRGIAFVVIRCSDHSVHIIGICVQRRGVDILPLCAAGRAVRRAVVVSNLRVAGVGADARCGDSAVVGVAAHGDGGCAGIGLVDRHSHVHIRLAVVVRRVRGREVCLEGIAARIADAGSAVIHPGPGARRVAGRIGQRHAGKGLTIGCRRRGRCRGGIGLADVHGYILGSRCIAVAAYAARVGLGGGDGHIGFAVCRNRFDGQCTGRSVHINVVLAAGLNGVADLTVSIRCCADALVRVAVGGVYVGCGDGLRVFTCIYCINHAGGGCADCHAGGVFSRLGGRTGELRTVLGICNGVGAGEGRGVVARA